MPFVLIVILAVVGIIAVSLSTLFTVVAWLNSTDDYTVDLENYN